MVDPKIACSLLCTINLTTNNGDFKEENMSMDNHVCSVGVMADRKQVTARDYRGVYEEDSVI